MKCNELIKNLELWFPKEISWQKDNAGLQVGSLQTEIKNIMLALDVTDSVIDEAHQKKCNLIITHHPLLFFPLRKIDTSEGGISAIAARLIRNDMTLYSAHTNFDYVRNGVSFSLAQALKLKNVKFLSPVPSEQYKLTVFVPESHLEKTAEAVFKAGGGIIGEYSKCSFRTEGMGTSKGSKGSNPAIGTKGVLTYIDEIKLEVVIDSFIAGKVISAVKEVHPYEEPAYDIIPLKNKSTEYGAGAIGELSRQMKKDEFLRLTARSLKCSALRYSSSGKDWIKRVAVCGGSGGEYLSAALQAGADAFITADVKYHTFQEAEGKILLVDAGHYETEVPSLDSLRSRIEELVKGKNINVLKFSGSTNPVNFYKSKEQA